MKRVLLLFALIILPLASARAQSTYSMPWGAIGPTGTPSSGGIYGLKGISGQTGGLQSGGVYALFGGFPVPTGSLPIGVDFVDPIPRVFKLSAPRPSPFRDQVVVAFELPNTRHVSVRVHSVDGRLLRKLVDSQFSAGRHRVRWDGTDNVGRTVHSGIYFVQVIAGSESATQRLIRLQ